MSDIKLRSFESKILFFNGMYKLPVSATPSINAVVADELKKDGGETGEAKSNQGDLLLKRLRNFKSILLKEVDEMDQIIAKVDGTVPSGELDVLVDLADLLADLQVYCASEMAKYGLPVNEVLSIVMSSNFSKLGPNGEPIYDEEGKVQKGPGYWKPEPLIRQLLQEKIDEAKEKWPTGIVWREDAK